MRRRRFLLLWEEKLRGRGHRLVVGGRSSGGRGGRDNGNRGRNRSRSMEGPRLSGDHKRDLEDFIEMNELQREVKRGSWTPKTSKPLAATRGPRYRLHHLRMR